MKSFTWRALVLASFFFMVNCSASRKQSRALKKAERAEREYREQITKAVEFGAIVDTTVRVIVHDTVRLLPTVIAGHEKVKIDTVRIYEACTEVVQHPGTAIRPGSVARLQRIACPPIAIDSTFKASASYKGVEYPFTVNVAIEGIPGALQWRILIGELSIPVRTMETAVKISPEIPKMRLKWWQWIAVAGVSAILFLVGFSLGRLTPR